MIRLVLRVSDREPLSSGLICNHNATGQVGTGSGGGVAAEAESPPTQPSGTVTALQPLGTEVSW